MVSCDIEVLEQHLENLNIDLEQKSSTLVELNEHQITNLKLRLDDILKLLPWYIILNLKTDHITFRPDDTSLVELKWVVSDIVYTIKIGHQQLTHLRVFKLKNITNQIYQDQCYIASLGLGEINDRLFTEWLSYWN